jgi:nitronate monooxygenase
MGGIALAELAAAVSEAGALGTIGLAVFGPEGIHNEISAARTRTKKPLAANLLIPFLRPGIVEAVVPGCHGTRLKCWAWNASILG